MTSRIYYTDAYCRTFDARVVRAFSHEGRPAAVLDRTAFYPSSGGQPHDLGALGGSSVVDVVDVVDVVGDVVHVLSSPLAEGAAVHGEIDWARRFDHMQQHTGQHVLSAALVHVCEAATVSFHLGTDTSTIDLAAAVSPADVERAVDEANRVVWEDREVAVRFASGDEARALPLRKESAREGELRLVEVPHFDLSACGGTHVARTGAIGLIAVTAAEKFKGGLRLTFVCGGRALRSFRQLRNAMAGSVRVLSVLPNELPQAIEKLQADGKDLRKTITGLQTALAVHEADRLLAAAHVTDGRRVITGIYEDWDAAGLKTIASSLIARDPVAVALVTGGPAATLVVACAPSLGLDAGAVVRQLTGRFGGRGGGRADMAQAGGLSGHTAEIAAAARALFESGAMTTPRIRLAVDSDAEAIAAIYRPVVESTAISFETIAPDRDEMARRLADTLVAHPWLVCDLGGRVAGYAYATKHRVRAAYQWSVDTSVYVDAACRRSGVGRGLYQSLFAVLGAQGFFNAFAGIALPNPASVALHESIGFEVLGVYRRVGFKLEAWHDVGWWQLALRAHDASPDAPLPLAAVQRRGDWAALLATGEPSIRAHAA